MKKNFSISDIENLIINKFREKDALSFMTNDVINDITNKVKLQLQSKINSNSKLDEIEETMPDNEEKNQKIQVNTPQTNNNPNISVQTTIDPEKEEIIKKEAELDIKEQELEQKQQELINQEINFEIQKSQLEYKPELPKALSSINPENSLIVFNNGELSLGGAALSNKKFHLKNNPDEKKSMHEFWIDNANTQSEVYLVELKKIGNLIFDPFQGTTVFQGTTEIITPEDLKNSNEDNAGLNPEDAVLSQIPTPENQTLDSIQPLTDVSMPMFNSDDFKNQELENSVRSIVEKIMQDELNKRNIFQQ